MKINVNGVERDATAQELAIIEATQADMLTNADQQQQDQNAKASALAAAMAKLETLGLTSTEIAALVGA